VLGRQPSCHVIAFAAHAHVLLHANGSEHQLEPRFLVAHLRYELCPICRHILILALVRRIQVKPEIARTFRAGITAAMPFPRHNDSTAVPGVDAYQDAEETIQSASGNIDSVDVHGQITVNVGRSP
jgi:hypothetical protein